MCEEPIDAAMFDDLAITKTTPRGVGAGAWVCGRVAGHRFEALVFPEHAESPECEVNGDSKISKLWIRRLSDDRTVFNWDRGADVPAADANVQAIVNFLCDGLAEHTFGA